MQMRQAFLDDIIAHPDDDAPRLIFADWLEEHGNPERAEFIRVQIELARVREDDPRGNVLRARENELLDAFGMRWCLSLTGEGVMTFRRGFVEGVEASGEWSVNNGEWVFDQYPIREMRIRYMNPSQVAVLTEWPQLRRLRELDLGGSPLGRAGLERVLTCPHLQELRTLDLTSTLLSINGTRWLFSGPGLEAGVPAAPLAFPRLETFDLSDNVLGDPDLRALITSPFAPQLHTFRMTGRRTPFVDKLHAHRVAILAGSRWRLRSLDLSDQAIGDAGLGALAASPLVGWLTSLIVADNHIGAIGGGLEALAESSHMDQLAELDLRGNPLGVIGGRALAEWPGLAGLRRRDLRDCGIPSAGARALADSPYLGKNLTLMLARNPLDSEAVNALQGRLGDRLILEGGTG
jgi:uncharacterized protein (TIGR02996 family)